MSFRWMTTLGTCPSEYCTNCCLVGVDAHVDGVDELDEVERDVFVALGLGHPDLLGPRDVDQIEQIQQIHDPGSTQSVTLTLA